MVGPHTDAPDEGPSSPRRRGLWRVAVPAIALLVGALFVVSATSSQGADLRPGRYTSLATLVQNESEDYRALQARAATLQERVDTLADEVENRQVRRMQQRAEELEGPAGLDPVVGEGVRIVMSDAPTEKLEEALASSDLSLDRFVVHQQDIQAVVNALWAGGAEAMTIQGQRVITTTGIKCTGSAVTLQGVPYPQPYVIEAVGDPERLGAALEADPDVTAFRADASRPEIGLGWEASAQDVVRAPAYEGLVDVDQAEPVEASG